MTTFFLTLLVIVFVVAGMAIGVILGRKPISGSCGGIANLGMKTECDICGGNKQRCEEYSQEKQLAKTQTSLAYNAADTVKKS